MSFDFSSDQNNALIKLSDWYKYQNNAFSDTPAFITLGGYAGTGKTTLISYFRQNLTINNSLKVAFCSYTGKATQVLKRKLIENNAIQKKDFIGTIHSLIYRTIEDDRGVVIGWELKDDEEFAYDLIIVDEASMVDQKIWTDLMSFRKPIIAVGDHGQLPPIESAFNLMQKPQIKLEKIHRQAQDNPIIKLSIMARETGVIPVGNYSAGVRKISMEDAGSYVEEEFQSYKPDKLILCGYNNSRVKINNAIRGTLGFETPEPSVGDRVICLRNNRVKAIFNGMLGEICDIKKRDLVRYHVKVAFDDDSYKDDFYEGIISKEQFSSAKTLNNINGAVQTQGMDLFDFGYAITVHKSQGSQAKKVILFEERFKNADDNIWKRWLYTAITRAEEELLIFGR